MTQAELETFVQKLKKEKRIKTAIDKSQNQIALTERDGLHRHNLGFK